MRRRNKNNRKNRKNRIQETKARLSMENLEPRQLMTASPVYGPLPNADLSPTLRTSPKTIQTASLVTHVADSDLSSARKPVSYKVSIMKKGKTIRIEGTPFNDYVEVTQPDCQHVKVTVYKKLMGMSPYEYDHPLSTEVRHVQGNYGVKMTSKIFKQSEVSTIFFDGKAGNDYLWNGKHEAVEYDLGFLGKTLITTPVDTHDLEVLAYGGSGNDRLEGGPQDDRLYGGANDDVLIGYNGDDNLFGDSDRVRMTLPGEDGDDSLSGGSGDDLLWGEGGNDNLYGHSGVDFLYGGDGLDGLFGGAGRDWLYGGNDPDRFLWQSGDNGTVNKEDAKIKFKDGSALKVKVGGAKWSAGAWSDLDIEAVDKVFRVLHLETGNTKLLDGFDMKRRGSPDREPDAGAWFNSVTSTISIPNTVMMHEGTGEFYETILHEIGHNWDKEHGAAWEWRSLSGWTKKGSGNNSTHQQSAGENNWRHLRTAKFVSDYAQTSPLEDFSETFAAVFMDKAGLSFWRDDFDSWEYDPDEGWIAVYEDDNIVGINELDVKREYIVDWYTSM